MVRRIWNQCAKTMTLSALYQDSDEWRILSPILDQVRQQLV